LGTTALKQEIAVRTIDYVSTTNPFQPERQLLEKVGSTQKLSNFRFPSLCSFSAGSVTSLRLARQMEQHCFYPLDQKFQQLILILGERLVGTAKIPAELRYYGPSIGM